MNALHQACARAIADEMWGKLETGPREKAAAAAAIRVCLAEVQRAVAANRMQVVGGDGYNEGFNDALTEAAAALAALAEEQA